MTEIIVWIISAGAVISLLIAFVRLLTAETEVDRVVSLDIVFSSGVALTGAAAVAQAESHFLDIGIALSVVGFVGTTLWARFIEASGEEAPRDLSSGGEADETLADEERDLPVKEEGS